MRNKARRLTILEGGVRTAEPKKWPVMSSDFALCWAAKGEGCVARCVGDPAFIRLPRTLVRAAAKNLRVWPVGEIAIGLLEQVEVEPTVWGAA
jgi:hypothetical protein